jgi:hypothetical protein
VWLVGWVAGGGRQIRVRLEGGSAMVGQGSRGQAIGREDVFYCRGREGISYLHRLPRPSVSESAA